jgi:hypothetical protein
VQGGGCSGVQGVAPPPELPQILSKLNPIPSSVENAFVHPESLTKSNRIVNGAEPLTRGLPPPDTRYLYYLSSTEFVDPPPRNKVAAYATALNGEKQSKKKDETGNALIIFGRVRLTTVAVKKQ